MISRANYNYFDRWVSWPKEPIYTYILYTREKKKLLHTFRINCVYIYVKFEWLLTNYYVYIVNAFSAFCLPYCVIDTSFSGYPLLCKRHMDNLDQRLCETKHSNKFSFRHLLIFKSTQAVVVVIDSRK